MKQCKRGCRFCGKTLIGWWANFCCNWCRDVWHSLRS